MAIESAVRLSWPVYNDDYILESAPEIDGPWSPVDTALSEENGMSVAYVKASGNRQFFRLGKP